MAVRPLTGYIGGKWNLRKVICPRIDADRHHCYVEPFVGMGNIFLGRQRRRRVEVLNDANGDVVNLFRVVQRHAEALAAELRFTIASRTEYARLLRLNPTDLTDIERAARFLVLRRLTYSGKEPYAAGFAWSKTSAKVIDVGELTRRIEVLRERLDRVTIEALDFEAILQRYDDRGTFFYLDPPYWGCTHLYRNGTFRQDDFGRLATSLRSLEGKWLLSINDRPEVRALLDWARIEVAETRYNASVGAKPFRIGEFLISKPGRPAKARR